MALLTISGDPASRWEEVARGTAQLLNFELVTETRLAQWMTEEFGETPIPARAWASAAVAVLARLAREHPLLIALDGSEHLFRSAPWLLRVRVVTVDAHRAGNLMLDLRLEKPRAHARLRELDADRKRLRKARFSRASADPAAFDLTLNLARVDAAQAAEMLAAAAAKRLGEQGLLAPNAADEIEFEMRLELAKRGIVPARRARLTSPGFGHPSEEMFANLLDFYRIQWEYEPRSFPLQWDKDGHVTEAFTPDFYLPEFDLYVELTTMRQSLVTKKNRKVKLLRAIYPHINIQVFYQKDFQDLVFKYGLRMVASSVTPAPENIERILFTEEQVTARIVEVAAEVSEKYRGRDLKLIAVLKGSVFFLTALARSLTIPVKIDFLAISSFGGPSHGPTPGLVRIAKDLDEPILDEDVLLVEDIVDTGFTTRYLLQTLAGRGPRSLGICTLLDRSVRRIVQVPVDFRCFEIPDRFVVGCGLDHKQLYRNLGYIAVLDPERS